MVALSGSVQNLVGNDYPDFVLVATPTQPFYTGDALTTTSSVYFPSSSGSITGSFPQTQTSGVLVAFSGNFTANGIFQEVVFIPTIIPNVASIGLGELLFPILNP